MPRPLMQLGVGELEALFKKSKTHTKVLKQLENELQYRQVPRAVALLAEVQTAMHNATYAAPVPSGLKPAVNPAPEQTGLWEGSTTAATSSIVVPIAAPRPADPIKTPAHPAVPKMPPTSQPEIDVDDAYKLLKATAASTWESIEETRRQMVLQSSPLITRSMSQDRRSQLLAEAKRINAAYSVLCKYRSGTR